MELEKAIKELESLSPSETAIETVLKALEELKEKELDYTTVYMNGVYDGKKRFKKKVEDKLEEIKNKEYFGLANAIKNSEINILQELLEE